MARLARVEVFAPSEIAAVHVISRVVRRCFLMGTDAVTGKNYDHRKAWIEAQLERFAGLFGIDLMAFAILSNHFHLVLRSRPDVVSTWSDVEVARRWRLICPIRKNPDGSAKEPNQAELNSLTGDPDKLKTIRLRLSDISWWMRLLNQRIAQRANHEDQARGRFWEARYKSVRLLDEESLLACSAYVDLNPIRAALAETLEASEHTSVQRRIQSQSPNVSPTAVTVEQAVDGSSSPTNSDMPAARRRDAFLSPVEISEARDALVRALQRATGGVATKDFCR